jgi:hydroxyethylthiazole kinase-like uncharacterized protein yjeF
MQRAATGLAVACSQRLGRVYAAPVVLLVGAGNNGADGLWAGAQLAARGARVGAVLVAEPVADALTAFRAAGGRVVDAPGPGLVVDGLVGIGGRGGLRPRAAQLAGQVRDQDTVAVDLPSGVDADTGEVAGAAVRADLTVTFGTLKPGLLLARPWVGELRLVDIGLGPYLPAAPVEALDDAAAARLLPRPQPSDDKYTRGVLGVAAGSQQYPGAAVLATGAAVRAGAGMVRFAGASHPAAQVRARWPEAVVTEGTGAQVVDAGRVQAWVVGPGLGTDGEAERTVEAVLAQDVPVLVDADGLTVLARHPEWLRGRTSPTLLTPHDREFARFGVEVGADRIGSARRLAAALGVHVLLKGDATIVVGPDGPARVNTTGTSALATAGSGDVLSGGTGALLAQGLTALDAGSVGAHLHGRAGALAAGTGTTSAVDVLEHWQAAARMCG